MEILSGGRIQCLLHMHRLLTDNVDGYTWYNYGKDWENEHSIPMDTILRSSSLETKLKVNNYKNMIPMPPLLNKSLGHKARKTKSLE
jgi:hypothetical protein